MITQNLEGFLVIKGELLTNLCEKKKCNVLCVQKSHWDEVSPHPKIPGMNLVIELLHLKYRSAIYSKPGFVVKSTTTRPYYQSQLDRNTIY